MLRRTKQQLHGFGRLCQNVPEFRKFLKMLMLCIICTESSGKLILSLDYLHEFWSLKYAYNYYLFKMYTTLKNYLVNP